MMWVVVAVVVTGAAEVVARSAPERSSRVTSFSYVRGGRVSAPSRKVRYVVRGSACLAPALRA